MWTSRFILSEIEIWHNFYGVYADDCLMFIRIIREIILSGFNIFVGKVWKNNFYKAKSINIPMKLPLCNSTSFFHLEKQTKSKYALFILPN